MFNLKNKEMKIKITSKKLKEIISTYVVEHDTNYDIDLKLINKYRGHKNWVVEYNGSEKAFIDLQKKLGFGGILESRFSNLSFIKRHLIDVVEELILYNNKI